MYTLSLLFFYFTELSHVAISSEGGGDNDTINGLPSAVPWTSSDEHLPSYSEVRHGSKGRTGTPDSASSSASSNGGRKSGGKSNKLATVRERQGSVMSQASTNFTSVSQQRPGGRPMPDVDQVRMSTIAALCVEYCYNFQICMYVRTYVHKKEFLKKCAVMYKPILCMYVHYINPK